MGYRGILILACLCAGSASAATIKVPADQSTIQAAIDAANNGDTVLVAPGIYNEQLDFKGKAITVTSSSGAADTILDGFDGTPVVRFANGEGNSSVLQGFTLVDAASNGLPAITIISASPTIEDNLFMFNSDNSQQQHGSCIGTSSLSPGTDDSSPVIIRNVFTQNNGVGFNAVVSLYGGMPVVADNVFSNNSSIAVFMWGFSSTGAPEIYNNTLVGNNYALYIAIENGLAGTTVSNNLVAFNKVGVFLGSALTFDNNLVYGNTIADYYLTDDATGQNGNFSADPTLKDWANGDVHLLYGSPAIDAGNNMAGNASSTDVYGDTRLFAGMPGDPATVDIGAVEYEPPVVAAAGASIDVQVGSTKSGTLGATGADPAEPLVFALASSAAHGTVTLTDASTGAFKYVSDQSYTGPDSFTFQITDPYGTVSGTATEQVTLTDATPVAYNGNLHGPRNTVLSGTLTASVPDTVQAPTFSLVTNPAHGNVNLNAATGAFTYTPSAGAAGADSFTFQVTDSLSLVSNVATENVNMADPVPKAYPASITVTPAPHSGVLKGTTAYAGQTLTYAIHTNPAHGSVSLNSSTGAYIYRANPSYRGADSFTFQVVDQWGTASNSATVSIKIR